MAPTPVLILSLRQIDQLIFGRLIFSDLPHPLIGGPSAEPCLPNPVFTTVPTHRFLLFKVFVSEPVYLSFVIPCTRMSDESQCDWSSFPSSERAYSEFYRIRSQIIGSFDKDCYTVEEIDDLIVVMKVQP